MQWVVWAMVVVAAQGAVIPPRWVNHTLNPCATKSWQLLYWPPDGSCHKIFTQGPCGDTQEFYYDAVEGAGACRCPRGKILYPNTGLCYDEFTPGPCPPGRFLGFGEDGNKGECRKFGECPPRHIFWPRDEECYQYHTRGPCLNGYLIGTDPTTGFPECGCDRNAMFSNYWSLTGLCFELYERGPCRDGTIFLYNATKGSTECSCSDAIVTNFHAGSGGCFELNQVGPCRPGQLFTFNPRNMTTQCQCREDHALWRPTGHCHRLYSRGPCGKGQFFVPATGGNSTQDTEGECRDYPCTGTRRYHTTSQECFRLGWQGPCPQGQLFIYDEESPLRGTCGCTQELVGFWPQDGHCYELGGRGPCNQSQVLSYDKATGGVVCTCDIRKGFILWSDERCYRVNTRGPCGLGEVLAIKRWRPLTPVCTNVATHVHSPPLLTLGGIHPQGDPPRPHHESNSVTAARGDSTFTLGANHTQHTNHTLLPGATPPAANDAPNGHRQGRRLSGRPAPVNIYSLVGMEEIIGSGETQGFPGRSGRSMADTETWGFLDGSYFKIPGTSPGTYYTGRQDGEPSLQPWWGDPLS